MKYQSTRDKKVVVESAQAIKQGLSKEGGLFVPCEFPRLTAEEIQQMVPMTYQQRAVRVLGKYLTDFTEEELTDCVTKAYGSNFEDPAIAPLHKLHEGAHILELWHGPTCAFKDMALQILPKFLVYSMKKTGEDNTVVILVATSGDTGKAALEGFKDVEGTRIVVFYPNDGVSDIQKLQMATQRGGNVAVGAVNGNFDDAQTGVKRIFTDKEYEQQLLGDHFVLSSANSINWGRLVPQVVYYISAYCDLVASGEIRNGDLINVCVPTGNFGNILAAYYASKMGLPVAKFLCASNRNNVLTDFIRTGTYDCDRDFYTTTSPSMDILISSNLERLLFDLYGEDDGALRQLMDSLKDKKAYQVSQQVREKVEKLFYGGCCDDVQTAETIRDTQQQYGYVLDTHTAVAVRVYQQYVAETEDHTPTVIASTASPYKFGDSVVSAIRGEEAVKGLDPFQLLEACHQVSGYPVPASLQELQTLPVRFSESFDKEEMQGYVDRVLGRA
ncbi:MAG: threonine synthase [Eubacteriales bacterium]|jgi:threonine synthase